MKHIFDFFANESDYPDLDCDGAVARLSHAIQCKTVNQDDGANAGEFEKLHALIRESYPALMAVADFQVIGCHSLLITIPGTNPSLRPCLYMSHLDVVPVVAGTEGDWTHDAFSGAVADGYIWGRGTLDIKDQVFGVLEAANYLLAHGTSFARTTYLAFGDDEETLNKGARAIAAHLQSQGVTLEFVLDEGFGKIENAAHYGAPGTYISLVDLMEKGYADLELSVKSAGGHSSRPFGGTSLGHMSQIITRIVENPFPVKLTPVMAGAFKALAPYITEEPLKTLVQDVDGNADAIAQYCNSVKDLFHFASTTIAPTIIRGSSAACNVMPQNMSAVINFRIAEGETVEDLLAHVKAAVNDDSVEMRFLQCNDPSATARTDGYGYAKLLETMEYYFHDVVFVPSQTAGATDAHHYEIICDTCLRCSPFMTTPEDSARGVHGTDERLAVRSYVQGIRALIRLMTATCVNP